MKLLVVLPFHEGDHPQLLSLLEWISELGGCPEHNCLLVCSRKTKPSLIESAQQRALGIFNQSSIIHPAYDIPNEKWPMGPNWLFESAAQAIQNKKLGPWLWLEPDAIPLCKNWLGYIERGYLRGGKPFMGPKLDPHNKVPGLAGVSVYPENTHSRIGSFLKDNSKPWDMSAGTVMAAHGCLTRLITHHWGRKGLPPTFRHTKDDSSPPNAMLLSAIPKTSALFHRCKDGSLISLLRPAPAPTKIVEIPPAYGKELTVVITSHQRPKHLLLAFESCRRAKVANIIVVATGDPQPMRQVFEEITSIDPGVIIFEEGNATSNQSWLHGVEAAETEYVSLLHDDDLLLPDYLSLLAPGLRNKAPFIMVQASNHGVPDYTEKDSDRDGLESSSVLRPRLEKKGNLAISPVRGVFRKTDLAQWLSECESMPKSCYFRPGFLVGNDLAIWLKAINKYSEFFNVPKPGVSFGHWEGSTTIDSLDKRDGKLFRIYDETRRWHAATLRTPIQILTIVLDGMPFIAQHLATFNRLNIPWEWHIVEGSAANTHCTKWCQPQAGRLSKDGTTAYLNQIIGHPLVHIYRKPLWDGKVEMVNAPLQAITKECILLEVDCDEFWTAPQIETMVDLFDKDRTRTHAMFWCRYFFGPHLVMESRNCYGNTQNQDWKRAWRFKPGDRFLSHEPPHLSSESSALMHEVTEEAGLVFEHYGYAQRSQVEFKEKFYGYKGALKHWDRLQQMRTGEAKLSDYLPWVSPDNSGIVRAI